MRPRTIRATPGIATVASSRAINATTATSSDRQTRLVTPPTLAQSPDGDGPMAIEIPAQPVDSQRDLGDVATEGGIPAVRGRDPLFDEPQVRQEALLRGKHDVLRPDRDRDLEAAKCPSAGRQGCGEGDRTALADRASIDDRRKAGDLPRDHPELLTDADGRRQVDRQEAREVARALRDRDPAHPAGPQLDRVLVDEHEVGGPVHSGGEVQDFLAVGLGQIQVRDAANRGGAPIDHQLVVESVLGEVFERRLDLERLRDSPRADNAWIGRLHDRQVPLRQLVRRPGSDTRRDRRGIERDLRDQALVL